MTPPDYLEHVRNSLYLMVDAHMGVLPTEGVGVIQPMIVGITKKREQMICLLESIEHRVGALTMLARKPEIESLVMIYDGYVTEIDPEKGKGMTRDNLDEYRKFATFPRQDAILIMTFQRDDPFTIGVDTYRYVRHGVVGLLDSTPSHHDITPDQDPRNPYWGVFDPDSPLPPGSALIVVPPPKED